MTTGTPLDRELERHRLLAHRRTLQLAHLIRQLSDEGATEVSSKRELVRLYNRHFGEKATLNDLNYSIESLIRWGALRRAQPAGVASRIGSRVPLRIDENCLRELLPEELRLRNLLPETEPQ